MSALVILLIDDDRDVAESLADFFAIQGHQVDIAATSRDGLSAAGEKDYDAILLDVGLPDLNGVETSQAIKAMKPDARIVLMTGYSRDTLENEFSLDDSSLVMTKPLNLDALSGWLAAG